MAKIIVTGTDKAVEKLARLAAGFGAVVEPYFEALPTEELVQEGEELPNETVLIEYSNSNPGQEPEVITKKGRAKK